MPFTLEKVYRTDGKDLRTVASTGTEASASEAAFDGKYIWFTQPVGNQVTGALMVLEYFGERSDNEPTADELDMLRYGRYESGAYRKMRVVAKLGASATTSTQTTSIRSLCEFPQYFDSAVGTYTEGTATVTVGMATLYVGLANEEKVVTVSRPRTDTSPSNMNPRYIQYSNGKMYVTTGLTEWKTVFEFDTTLMKFAREIKVTEGMPSLTPEFSYPTSINSVAVAESANYGRPLTAVSTSPMWNECEAICKFNVNLGTEFVPGVSPQYYATTAGLPFSYFDSVTAATSGTILLVGQTDKSQNGEYYWHSTYGLSKKTVTSTPTWLKYVHGGTLQTGAVRADNGVWFQNQDGSFVQALSVPGPLSSSSTLSIPAGIVDGVLTTTGMRVLILDKTGFSTVVTAPAATLQMSYHSPSSSYRLNLTIPLWPQATDFDSEAENTNVYVKVTGGTTYANSTWLRTSSAVAWSSPTSATNIIFLSNMQVTHGRIWAVSKMLSTNQPQYLIGHDIQSGSKFITAIPARPSSSVAWIAPGYNGHVYVTNYNNFSVTKVNADTGVVSSVIRLNSSPTRIYTDSARRIWVSSYAGMLSLVDYDDDQVHNDFGSVDGIISFAADTSDASKLWWVDATNKLVRMDINTKQVLETEGTSNDWNIISKEFALMRDHGSVFVTPFVQYAKENGDMVTVRPYLFTNNFVSSTEFPLICFRLDSTYFFRDAYCEVNGQGAVVDGAQEYFGE